MALIVVNWGQCVWSRHTLSWPRSHRQIWIPRSRSVIRYMPPRARSSGAIRRTGNKTQWCSFQAEGKCERGALCTFVHAEAELGKTWPDRVTWVALYKQVVCRYFKRGSHVLYCMTFASHRRPSHIVVELCSRSIISRLACQCVSLVQGTAGGAAAASLPTTTSAGPTPASSTTGSGRHGIRTRMARREQLKR